MLSEVRVIASTSAQQSGHQAKAAVARRTTRNVSVSTVILVVLRAMARSHVFVGAAYRLVQAHPAGGRDRKSLNPGSEFLKSSQSFVSD
jgi:hypothetical protein